MIMKIGTINVGLFDFIKDLASWKNRAKHLSKIVANEKIDILMLQEVYEIKWNEASDKLKNAMRSAELEEEDYNKFSILRECLPSDYNFALEKIQSIDRGIIQPGLYWGLAIVVKFPIILSEHFKLTYTKFDRWPRIVQSCELSMNKSESFGIINIHLPVETRRARLRGALEVINHISKKEKEIRFVGGDLNDSPYNGPIYILNSLFNDAWKVANLKNVFYGNQEVGNYDSIYRIVRENRIDYILSKKNIKVKSCKYYFDDLEPVTLSDHPLVIMEVNDTM